MCELVATAKAPLLDELYERLDTLAGLHADIAAWREAADPHAGAHNRPVYYRLAPDEVRRKIGRTGLSGEFDEKKPELRLFVHGYRRGLSPRERVESPQATA